MKYSHTLLTSFLIAFTLQTNSFAANNDSLPKVTSLAGTGCSATTTNLVTNPNLKTITSSVLLSSYDAGKNSISGKKRSACSFAIPFKVPVGFQISQLSVTWKGHVKGKGQLGRKYFLAGRPNSSWKRSSYNKPNGGDFTEHDTIHQFPLSKACNGGRYNLRINSQVKVKGEDSHIMISPTEKITFKLYYKPCR